MKKYSLRDGNIYYIPDYIKGFNKGVEQNIDEIYNSNNPHYYERYYTIKNNMIVLDAGAYTGLFTLKASKLVGPKGIVIALEPFYDSYKVLEYNIKKNKCNNVILINEGLGNELVYKKLIVGDNYISSLIMKEHDSKKMKIMTKLYTKFLQITKKIKMATVKLTTIDNLLNSLNIEKIDYLKIDIEGYEEKALEGYSKINKDTIIILETHNNLDKIIHSLKNKGCNMEKTYIEPINGNCSIIHTKF